MSNKKTKIISTLIFVSTIFGCSNNVNSSNSNSSSSSISIIKEKSFLEMLDELKNPNITYHSDYQIYTYPENAYSELEIQQRYDVYAKITEDLYEMKAYEYDTDKIASAAHLEQDEEGYVTYSSINIKNELVVERAIDSNNEEFLWEESVYFNLICKLDAKDFEKTNDTTYYYRGELTGIPLNILHTAIPTSFFDMESFKVIVKNNQIDSFEFQEIESEEAYEGYMYGRTLSIKFEDIGTTSISRIAPYEAKEENKELGLALEELRKQTNYTITSIGVLEDNTTKPLKETYITTQDILQKQYLGNEVYETGIHSYNGKMYNFETKDKYLLGTETTNNVNDYIPTFDFSENIFKYMGEENGSKVYTPFGGMEEVLNYINVISEHAADYFSPEGDIKFFVKNSKIEKIEFPIYPYDTANYYKITNRITYDNFGETTIDSSKWDSFVLELPGNEASAWSEYIYDFEFEYSPGQFEYMNLGSLFEKCLGDANKVPYFLPSSSNVEVSGNYSSSDKVVYVTLESLKGVDAEILRQSEKILTEAGFSKKEETEDIFTFYTYKLDNIRIEFLIIAMDNFMEIVITLPVGDLFK